MGRSVEAVLAAETAGSRSSAQRAVTALTRIAKLAGERRSTLGGKLNF